jgi:hypothetical protein
MRYGKHLLRTLGLSLVAALGLMAFGAVGAQAAGEILVEGSAALATGRLFAKKQEGESTLLVPSLNIAFVCKKVTGGGTILSGPLGTFLLEALFEECVVWSVSKETKKLIEVLTSCQILASGATKTKGHISIVGVGGVILHNINETYLLLEGEKGEIVQPLATVEFTKGIGCALSNPVKLTGAIVSKVVTGNLNTGAAVVEPLVESSEFIQKLIGDKLFYGVNEAFLDGSWLWRQAGIHAGLKWGFK